MVSQQRWRIAGGACLVICIIMAIASLDLAKPDISVWVLVGYWGIFVLLLVAAIYIAVLDFRYTRVQYKVNERDIFRDTFMTPEFRQAIQDARKEEEKAANPEKN